VCAAYQPIKFRDADRSQWRLRQTLAAVSQRILIVDDELANIELLKGYLADTADEFCGITDSKNAERAFLEFEPDIVLLDLHMPEPDGLEILRRLGSARASLGFLPVIVLTADERNVARNSALILGANDFLIKPLDRQEVRLRVRNLLQTRFLFKELKRATGSFPAVDQHRSE
jgi:PleD family two-component response regulator